MVFAHLNVEYYTKINKNFPIPGVQNVENLNPLLDAVASYNYGEFR